MARTKFLKAPESSKKDEIWGESLHNQIQNVYLNIYEVGK